MRGKPVGGPARRRYRGPVANEDPPDGLSQLAFHGPMSEARAALLTARLARASPGTILDIGCGWGELMLRLLAAAPGATGLGIDVNDADLTRGRANARARGLSDRVTFARESGIGTSRGTADLVLCLGSSHALSDAEPPLGEGIWEHPPTDAELAAMWPGTAAGDLPDLATLVDLAVDAGFRPAWIETASPQEWEEFESGYQADQEEWLAAHPGHPRAAEVRERVDEHRLLWLRGYRNVLGLAYLTLVPAG